MNAAERRKVAYDSHREFLFKVTGVPFFSPQMSRGDLMFRSIPFFGRSENGSFLPCIIESRVSDVGDLVR